MIGRGLLRRCPVCSNARIWWSRTQLQAGCSRCGFPFEREEGYWVGAIIVNTAVAEALFGILFVGTLIATWPEVPWQPLVVVALLTNVVVPILFYPRSKTVWLAFDLFFNPRRSEERGTAEHAAARR